MLHQTRPATRLGTVFLLASLLAMGCASPEHHPPMAPRPPRTARLR